jgi:hypothetical protein
MLAAKFLTFFCVWITRVGDVAAKCKMVAGAGCEKGFASFQSNNLLKELQMLAEISFLRQFMT